MLRIVENNIWPWEHRLIQDYFPGFSLCFTCRNIRNQNSEHKSNVETISIIYNCQIIGAKRKSINHNFYSNSVSNLKHGWPSQNHFGDKWSVRSDASPPLTPWSSDHLDQLHPYHEPGPRLGEPFPERVTAAERAGATQPRRYELRPFAEFDLDRGELGLKVVRSDGSTSSNTLLMWSMITMNTVINSAFGGDVVVTKVVASLTGLIWAHRPLMHDGWGRSRSLLHSPPLAADYRH